MALTEDQKRQLNQQCNRMPLIKLIEYIDKGFVMFPDDLPSLSDDRKKAIQEMLDSRPNPQEQNEWNAILPDAGNLDEALMHKVETYIQHWESRQPVGHHLNEARKLIEEIKDNIYKEIREKDEADWQLVDKTDEASLRAHLKTYNEFCSHKAEIEERLTMLTEWADIRDNGDLLTVYEYIQNHPDSVFAEEAAALFQQLKADEIQSMIELQANYPIENLLYYLKNSIFTEEELIEAEVATDESLKILYDIEKIKEGLPDVNAEIAKCKKVCAEGHTDVFLFGIPSTGKSCILMGLIGSSEMIIDPIRAGGPYSDALQQYLDAGLTIGQTPKNFVATIEASISDGKGKHLLNLVEMSGEDFAFKIADNENGKISFEDMGNGATRLLCNDNRKVFFIIVDPTARVVAFNHLVEDSEGSYLVRKNVNQRITLNRMVGLLRQPENKKILKKVESIHIIMTKSDTLGSVEERDKKAIEHFTKQYQTIIKPLAELCKENGINRRTGGMPKLYTFSLGKFYVGGVYKYDPTDANKLVQILKHDTESIGKGGFFDKVRDVFN